MLEKHVGAGECRVCNRHALPENNAEARSRPHREIPSCDLHRLVLQQAEGISAGDDLLRTRMIHVPFSKPTRKVTPLNLEGEEIILTRRLQNDTSDCS